MSAFLYRRGKGVKRRVAHLAMYNCHGEIVGPWCQRRVNLDTSCNLPLGLRICKLCLKAQGAALAAHRKQQEPSHDTNKPEVKRYNVTIDKYDHPVPYETEHGQWVKYSSYKALQAENERLRDVLLRMSEAISGYINESTGIAGYHMNGDIEAWGETDLPDLVVEADDVLVKEGKA